MQRQVLVAAVSLALAAVACARVDPRSVETREIEYRQGETVLQGLLAWSPAAEGRRPGVLVVHEWWGHNEHARTQARRLAEAGYVGFAVDMYGKGKLATHPQEAEAFLTEATKDPAVVAARFAAALEQLKQDSLVDPERIAAIGYCFGGAVVLAAARSGADLDAVVSFHGALGMSGPVDSGKVRARVLVLTGGADPFVPPEQVAAFTNEMHAAGARFEVITYPGAKHSFTNPGAGQAGMEQLAYDAAADSASWAAMRRMLEEVFDGDRSR